MKSFLKFASTAAAFLLFVQAVPSYASQTVFTWLRGNDAMGKPGIYGTPGIGDPNNTPGTRYGQNRWKDSAGNLWMFGGTGRDALNNGGVLNDLWKFNIATGDWVWVSGGNVGKSNGSFGPKGIPSVTSVPGGRGGSATWIDPAGNLWMFGGTGLATSGSSFGMLDQVWKFDVASGLWTWVAGEQSGDLPPQKGPQGVPSPGNTPGGITWPAFWSDSDGNLFIFGGQGYDGTKNDLSSDLWKFDISTSMWTFLGGNGSDVEPVYGTLGIGAASNHPGARGYGASWKDKSGMFWLFGGRTKAGGQNDVWRLDPSTLVWTWVSGLNVPDQPGVYGTLGQFSASSYPSSRYNVGFDADPNGNLILYSGYSTEATHTGKSDLWKYDVQLNGWTLLGGTDGGYDTAVYGTQGVSDPANTPGGQEAASLWAMSSNNLYIFGGARAFTGSFNALWLAKTTYSTDLSVALTSAVPGIILGQGVTCTATVTNTGLDPAEDVSASLAIPPAAMNVSAIASQGTSQFNDAVASANFGTLAPGASATLTVSLLPTVPGSVPVSVQVATSTPDVSQANDTALFQIEVVQGDGPDLTATSSFSGVCKTSRKGTTCKLKGTVTVTNSGNQNSEKSSVAVFLSDDAKFNDTDVPLKSLNVKKLKVGRSANKRVKANLPAGVLPGGKYVIAVLDQPNAIGEGNEFNNVKVFGPLP